MRTGQIFINSNQTDASQVQRGMNFLRTSFNTVMDFNKSVYVYSLSFEGFYLTCYNSLKVSKTHERALHSCVFPYYTPNLKPTMYASGPLHRPSTGLILLIFYDSPIYNFKSVFPEHFFLGCSSSDSTTMPLMLSYLVLFYSLHFSYRAFRMEDKMLVC